MAKNPVSQDVVGACLVCGQDLIYFPDERELTCEICGQKFHEHVTCVNGHYVCNRCHSEDGIGLGLLICRRSKSKNPVEILNEIMDEPSVYMHGPEHHVLVGAALLTAYHNAGGQLDLEAALQEMKKRGSAYPGGSCGFWGCCGAAVSVGMFFSIINETTPLSGQSWGDANQITGQALQAIAAHGGPRCCKRNSYTAILEAIKFVREHMGVAMEQPRQIVCRFYPQNKQCLGPACPFFPQR